METKYLQLKFVGIVLLLSLLPIYAHSQAVLYYFDGNGNRTAIVAAPHAPERRKDTSKVKVYPNPTNGFLNVSISSFDNCNYADIYVIDGTGNVLSTQKTSSLMTSVNLSSYNQGLYYLRTVMCDQQYTIKIVKVNPGAPGKPLPTPVKY
jgi:hypothetical protein